MDFEWFRYGTIESSQRQRLESTLFAMCGSLPTERRSRQQVWRRDTTTIIHTLDLNTISSTSTLKWTALPVSSSCGLHVHRVNSQIQTRDPNKLLTKMGFALSHSFRTVGVSCKHRGVEIEVFAIIKDTSPQIIDKAVEDIVMEPSDSTRLPISDTPVFFPENEFLVKVHVYGSSKICDELMADVCGGLQKGGGVRFSNVDPRIFQR